MFTDSLVSSAWFVVLRNALDGCYLIFLVCAIARPQAVRGTRQRYVLATVQRLVAYPALGFLALSAARGLALDKALLVVLLIPMGLAAWVYAFERMRNDGDDNFFSDLGKRLRAWTRSKTGSLSAPPTATSAT